jgi:hypothetical protein
MLALGNETKTMAQWAEVIGLNTDVIHHRLTLGWSVEDSLTISKLSRSKERIILEYNGMSLGFKGWSEITGIPKKALYNRYHEGWDVKRILTASYKGKKNA